MQNANRAPPTVFETTGITGLIIRTGALDGDAMVAAENPDIAKVQRRLALCSCYATDRVTDRVTNQTVWTPLVTGRARSKPDLNPSGGWTRDGPVDVEQVVETSASNGPLVFFNVEVSGAVAVVEFEGVLCTANEPN